VNNLLGLSLLLAGGIFYTAGDILIKKWTLSNSSFHYILGIFIYAIGINCLAHSFKYKNMVLASLTIIIFNIITLIIFNNFYFNEKVSTNEFFGIVLAIISICLIESS
jgi:multidrug transporter EmrE-like cation transporter